MEIIITSIMDKLILKKYIFFLKYNIYILQKYFLFIMLYYETIFHEF